MPDAGFVAQAVRTTPKEPAEKPKECMQEKSMIRGTDSGTNPMRESGERKTDFSELTQPSRLNSSILPLSRRFWPTTDFRIPDPRVIRGSICRNPLHFKPILDIAKIAG